MRVKALKTIVGDYGRLARGAEDDIDDVIAKKLIKAGYVTEVTGESDGVAHGSSFEGPALVDATPAEPAPAETAPAAEPTEEPRKGKKGKTDADTTR